MTALSSSLDDDQYKSEGKLTLKIGYFSKFSQKPTALSLQCGSVAYIRGIRWQICAMRGKDAKFLEIFVNSILEKTADPNWSCDAAITLKIQPQQQAEGNVPKKMRLREQIFSSSSDGVYHVNHIFCAKSQSRVFPCAFEELMDPSNGWYEPTADSITIDAVVQAKIPCGVGLDLHKQFQHCSLERSQKLFESGEHSDFTIQFDDPADSKNNKDFYVHKYVLALHSDVFGTMFSNQDTMECRESRMKIVDSTARAIHQMLHFIYAGKLPADFQREDAVELLKLADKYHIEHLAIVSEEQLVASLALDNVCARLVLADRHNALSLQIACGQMIRANYTNVKKQAEWATLKKTLPDLVIIVLEGFHSEDST